MNDASGRLRERLEMRGAWVEVFYPASVDPLRETPPLSMTRTIASEQDAGDHRRRRKA